ncbi:helix-turn-helix domain-containing protein [Streptomyces rhizosphaericola]|uniref:XRE family transcriptional regulator n=1 Tax=Streptomyces rhizosphaericola TaxID=2564098 RepID=A0ABY2PLV2_9ACTN|nr:helix-turn-helix transcriptional regulator [Streptomyces rhizosphaericola]TGZ11791.1 XRE family transcriptional regulator [Streptomyces rhizosphaericola]
MRPRSGPTVQHRVLAARLRILREQAGISLRAAADALGAHPATVRRIERAETGLDVRQVTELLRCYGAPPRIAEPILAGLGAANLPGWWHRWRDTMEGWQQDVIGVESSASLVRTWHPALVPELLRTPDYAAGLDRMRYPDDGPDRIERRVELLRERQRRLCERGTALWALFPAVALLTRVGGPETMAGQRRALAAAMEQQHVTVQVVPLDHPPHAMTGMPPLHLLRVPAPEIGDQAVLETPGVRVDLVHEPEAVMAHRIRLDAACAAAPPPETPLPDPAAG